MLKIFLILILIFLFQEENTVALEREVKAMRVEVDFGAQDISDVGPPTPRAVKEVMNVISNSKPPNRDMKYKIGDVVEARYNGKDVWYSGEIYNVNKETNSYDIAYDDGEKEQEVREEFIRLFKRPIVNNNSTSSFKIGDRIEGNYQGSNTFYPGKIVRAHGDNKYDILYDDGEQEDGVKAEFIRIQTVVVKPQISQVDGEQSYGEEEFDNEEKTNAQPPQQNLNEKGNSDSYEEEYFDEDFEPES